MIYRPLCLLLRNKTSRWLLFLVNCYYTVHHAALTRILQIYFTMLLVLQLPRVILWLRHRLNYVRTRVSVHRTRRYFVLRTSSSKRVSVNKQEGLEIEVKSTAGNFFLAIKMNTPFTHILKIFLFFFFFFFENFNLLLYTTSNLKYCNILNPKNCWEQLSVLLVLSFWKKKKRRTRESRLTRSKSEKRIIDFEFRRL